MEARLQKWGNSIGIRIPMNMLKTLNLKLNDSVELINEDNKIVIIKKEKKISLKDKIANYKGENLAKDFVWDDNKGNEIW